MRSPQKIQFKSKQRGVTTLVVALILLFAITLITLYTGRSAVMEQNISAAEYRDEQAFTAATAAMDYAAYYVSNEGAVSDLTQAAPWSNAGDNMTLSRAVRMFFCDTADANYDAAPLNCTTPAASVDSAGIVAVGYSDDNSSIRILQNTIMQLPLVPGDGPGASVASRGGVNATGNINVINRYTNNTIWTSKTVDASGSMATYTAAPEYAFLDGEEGTVDYEAGVYQRTYPEVGGNDGGYPGASPESNAPADYSRASSNSSLGVNADILDNDPNLDAISPDVFWAEFFRYDRATYKEKATVFDNTVTNAELEAESGMIWIEGDYSIGGGTVGCRALSDGTAINANTKGEIIDPEKTVSIVVNGTLSFGAGGRYCGLIYAVGNMSFAGGAIVQGMVVSEAEIVSGGGGNPTFVYDPNAFGSIGSGLIGASAGTWRDWAPDSL